jgi:hypothetical protein
MSNILANCSIVTRNFVSLPYTLTTADWYEILNFGNRTRLFSQKCGYTAMGHSHKHRISNKTFHCKVNVKLSLSTSVEL